MLQHYCALPARQVQNKNCRALCGLYELSENACVRWDKEVSVLATPSCAPSDHWEAVNCDERWTTLPHGLSPQSCLQVFNYFIFHFCFFFIESIQRLHLFRKGDDNQKSPSCLEAKRQARNYEKQLSYQPMERCLPTSHQESSASATKLNPDEAAHVDWQQHRALPHCLKLGISHYPQKIILARMPSENYLI